MSRLAVSRIWVVTLVMLVAVTGWAQLPPESVMLDRVKVSQRMKPADLCPVYLVPSDPALPTWVHDGVTYRGSQPDAKRKFLQDPARYAPSAEKERFILNFMESLSTIWCPLTDEVTPGGMLQWEHGGLTWESCCVFCDENAAQQDFVQAQIRLRKRAERSFALMGIRYTEGAASPVEGAIRDPSLVEQGAELVEPESLENARLEPTYVGGIGVIFENRCVQCHRQGGAAPMGFTTYGEIYKWSKSVKTAVIQRTMPPWPADPAVGSFANSQALTPKEMDALVLWMNQGFPEGEGQFEPQRTWTEEWSIGAPDAVFELPQHSVGEDVEGEIREFAVQTDFTEDRWIVASEAKPGNDFLVLAIEGGSLGSYRTGNTFWVHAPGSGRLLRAGARIRVGLHYLKEKGYPDTDQSRLGVVFAEDPSSIRRSILSNRMAAADFTIPAGDAHYEVRARFKMPSDGHLIALMPVMLQRGKDVTYQARFENGTETTLLSIPRWDPEWKYRYQLRAPLPVPKGTVIEAIAHFDNSAENDRNPDATLAVKSGPSGEIFEGWISYSFEEVPR